MYNFRFWGFVLCELIFTIYSYILLFDKMKNKWGNLSDFGMVPHFYAIWQSLDVAFRVKCKNFSHKMQKGRLKGILFPLKRPFCTHFLGS